MMKIKPFEHQQAIVVKNPTRTVLNWSTGTGKTLALLLLAQKNVRSVLIICPKGVKEKWVRTCEEYEWFDIHYRVMTKEEFRRDWEKLPKFKGVIVDEVHYFLGQRGIRKMSKMTKALEAYLSKHEIEYRWFASATTYLSTPWNIFRLAWLLGYRWNAREFQSRFMRIQTFGNRSVWVPRSGIQDEMANLVAKIGDIVDINEAFDVPEQIFEKEYFELNRAQQKAIEKVKEEEDNPGVAYSKIHQIINGTLKGDEFNKNETFKCAKHDRLIELAESNKKLAVICRYQLEVDQLEEMFKKKVKGKDVFCIRGGMKNLQGVIDQAEASDDAVIIISMGVSEGYELPSFGVIAFTSLSFSYKDYKQIHGRFLRANALKKNVYIYLIMRKSMDLAVYRSMENKQDFDVAIYAKQQEQ